MHGTISFLVDENWPLLKLPKILMCFQSQISCGEKIVKVKFSANRFFPPKKHRSNCLCFTVYPCELLEILLFFHLESIHYPDG